MPVSKVSNRHPIIVGHRGASGLAPENTLAAFALAVELNADGVEFDVQRSQDGHLVIFHDDDVERVTDGQGWLEELTLPAIQKLDAGVKFDARFAGERIPTLAEFFDFMRNNALLMFLELKSPARYPGMVTQIVDLIRRYDYIERVQVRSFDHSALHEFNRAAPEIAISELWYERIPAPGATSFPTLNIDYTLYTKEVIDQIHQRRQKATAWTVNEIEDARRLIEWGIDGLTTDYPDRILALIR